MEIPWLVNNCQWFTWKAHYKWHPSYARTHDKPIIRCHPMMTGKGKGEPCERTWQGQRCNPAGFSPLQAGHKCRLLLWGQMLRPPHSLQVCFWRLCLQYRRIPKLSPCVGVSSIARQIHRFPSFLVQGKWPKCGTNTRNSSVLGFWKNQLLLSFCGHCGHFSWTSRSSLLKTVSKLLLSLAAAGPLEYSIYCMKVVDNF